MTQEYNYHTVAMGCSFDMTFITETMNQADRYFTQASDIAKSYEKRFSRFDKDSELSRLNKQKSMRVSKDFLEVYWMAYQLYKETDMYFNPLVQVSNIGYDKSFEKFDDNSLLKLELKNTDYDINLDNVAILKNQIILQESQNLDFGGFLKGYVAQKIAQSIDSGGGIIINIGGDMYVRGSDENRKKFVIEIANPCDESKNISLSLLNKSLCTSGTYKRQWTTNSGKKHHIVDTGTNDSAQTDIISVSIIHSKGVVADAYATMSVTLGLEGAVAFLEKQVDVDFVLIDVNGGIIKSDNIKL